MEGDDEATLMAQAMGFSSFGHQDRPQKKRKYNSRADAAFVDARPQEEDAASGANSTALGVRTATTSLNAAEIDLDEDDDDDKQEEKPRVASTTTAATAMRDENLGGAVVDSTTSADAQVRPASLPQRPASGTGFVGRQPHQAHQQPHRGSQSSQPWYDGYYDPTSNENPWMFIEKARGLESRGPWLSRRAGVSAQHAA